MPPCDANRITFDAIVREPFVAAVKSLVRDLPSSIGISPSLTRISDAVALILVIHVAPGKDNRFSFRGDPSHETSVSSRRM